MKIIESHFERELKLALVTIHKNPPIKHLRAAVKSLKFAVEYDKPSREALGTNLNHVQTLIATHWLQKRQSRQQYVDFFISMLAFVRSEIRETWPEFSKAPKLRKSPTLFERNVLDACYHFKVFKRSYPNCLFIEQTIEFIEFSLKHDIASRYHLGQDRLPDALALVAEQKAFWKKHGKKGWMLQEYFFSRYLEFLPMQIRWLPWD